MRVQESLKIETTKFKTDSMTFCTKFFCFRDFSVPNFFENGSDTFFGTKKNRDQFRDFFRYQIFFETDSGTFFGTKFLSIPIPRLFSVPNFFRDRFRNFFRYQIFPIPVPIPSKKDTNSREREFPGPGRHTLFCGPPTKSNKTIY